MNILTSVLLIASLNRAYSSYHNTGVAISGERAKKFLVNDHLYGSCNLTTRLSTAELMVPLNAVAFNARHTQDITPALLEPLTFDDVVFNLGQAYRNGVFVAPYSGLYLFLVSLCSNGRTRIIYSLVSSAHEICSLEVGGSIVNACSIGTSITELQAGDAVSVVHHGDKFDLTRGIPHDLNSFTGVLLGLKHNYGDGVSGERAKRVLVQDSYYEVIQRLDRLTTRLSAVENIVPRQVVAFKANCHVEFSPVSADYKIPFNDVQFNLGQAYRGVLYARATHYDYTFVAPYNGVYLFSVSMCSTPTNWIRVALLHNGNKIGQVMAEGKVMVGCSSETTITELQAGDDVHVRHTGSFHNVTGGNVPNSFSGFLLSLG